MIDDLHERISAAYTAINENRFSEAAELITRVEDQASSVTNNDLARGIWANLSGAMIDLGTYTHDESLLTKGTRYAAQVIEDLNEKERFPAHYYNAANGYSTLWQWHSQAGFKSGCIGDAYLQAKAFFRKAIELSDKSLKCSDLKLCHSIYVNYANCLDSIGRNVEAITWYDKAIKLEPTMAIALGNKALTLEYLSFRAHGRTHAFLLEARALLQAALQQHLDVPVAQTFQRHLEGIETIIYQHGRNGIEAEECSTSLPMSPFHKFLQHFCAQHQLFLTPTAFLSTGHVFGDPLFISQMTASLDDENKFDRYITFLNQIKQDYVLARYFLVQSQYRSDVIDVIDQDVALYYPLDYSLHSVYIELLKSSLRLAVDMLDKIAYFIRDYCAITDVAERKVNFRTILSTGGESVALRSQLAARENPYLLALLDMAVDLRRNGYFERIYESRNKLTHKFLVVHDMILDRQTNPDIPRSLLRDFTNDCIRAMQIARAAVMYLILFVDLEEMKAMKGDKVMGILGTPVDKVFRWVPSAGVA